MTTLDGSARTILYRHVIGSGGVRSPLSLAWSLQVDQQLTKRVLLRAGYEERQTRNDFVIDPFIDANGNGLLRLENSGNARYREFSFTARVRAQENRDLFFAYVRSRAEGDLNDFNSHFGNLRNPVIRANDYSKMPFDAPNRFLFWGDIAFPKKVIATPVIEYRSGFPYSLVDEDQNFVGRRNLGGRFPNFFKLDLQVTKGLTIRVPKWKFIPQSFRGKEYKGRAGIKLFNITSHWNPRDVQNNIDAAAFGTFYNSVRRGIRLKFEFLKF